MASQPFVGFLIVGDELLDGTRTDLHTQWMANALRPLGLTVERTLLVRDDAPSIKNGLHYFSTLKKDPLWLFVSGGLGPTSDDITTQTICDHFGWELERNEEALAWVRALCERLNLPFGQGQQKQCDFPKGSTVLSNSNGTAAGFMHQQGASPLMTVLPGPPHELRAMFLERVIPALQKRQPLGDLRTRVLQTFFTPESLVAQKIELEDEEIQKLRAKGAAIRIGYREKRPRIFVKVEWKDSKLNSDGERIFESIRQRLNGVPAIESSEDDLESLIIPLAQERRWTICAAESCTGGLLSGRLTSAPGASRVIHTGYVTYSPESKVELLGLDPRMMEREGVVSEAVAGAMARAAALKQSTTFGIGVTGVAGPDGGTDKAPVGTVFIGLFDSRNEETRVFAQRFRGDRTWIRQAAVESTLSRLYMRMAGLNDATQ